MSDFLDTPDSGSGGGPDDGSRRRAVWGLVVLACVALIVGSLMVLLGGGSGHKHDDATLDAPVNPGPATTTRRPSGTPVTPTTGRSDSISTSTVSTPSSPPHTGNPCQGAPSCAVDGDGDLSARLNIYRAEHGQPAVPGKVSVQAQKCALAKGNGPSCVPHYIWTVAPSQDGKQALGKLTAFGSTWLLDSKMSSFDVGWAYVGGSYQCVILKTLTTD